MSSTEISKPHKHSNHLGQTGTDLSPYFQQSPQVKSLQPFGPLATLLFTAPEAPRLAVLQARNLASPDFLPQLKNHLRAALNSDLQSVRATALQPSRNAAPDLPQSRSDTLACDVRDDRRLKTCFCAQGLKDETMVPES